MDRSSRETRLEYELESMNQGDAKRQVEEQWSIKRSRSNGQHTRRSGPAQVASPCRVMMGGGVLMTLKESSVTAVLDLDQICHFTRA